MKLSFYFEAKKQSDERKKPGFGRTGFLAAAGNAIDRAYRQQTPQQTLHHIGEQLTKCRKAVVKTLKNSPSSEK